MNNDFVPEIIKDLITRHQQAKGHEKLVLQARIESISEYCNKYLEKIKNK